MKSRRLIPTPSRAEAHIFNIQNDSTPGSGRPFDKAVKRSSSVSLGSKGRAAIYQNNRLAGTPEENKEAVAGNISTFGTYTVNSDGSISYHIIGSSFPNWDGTNQKRLARITGDEMTWTNPTASTGAGNAVLTLKRAK